MKETYKKPMVLSASELAEGVYAASGGVAADNASGGNVTFREKSNEFWSEDNGQIVYTFDYSGEHSSHYQLEIHLAGNVANAWGQGNVSLSGSKAIAEVWGGSDFPYDFTIQGARGMGITSVTITDL